MFTMFPMLIGGLALVVICVLLFWYYVSSKNFVHKANDYIQTLKLRVDHVESTTSNLLAAMRKTKVVNEVIPDREVEVKHKNVEKPSEPPVVLSESPNVEVEDNVDDMIEQELEKLAAVSLTAADEID